MNHDIADELAPVFFPRSVALVGISKSMANVGYHYLLAMQDMGFPNIYPVNPKGGELSGVKVYRNIRDIPGEVDLALLTVPREAVPDAIRACTRKGVKAIVLFTGGFGESGPEGRAMEEGIVRIAREGGTRLIGPNCLGPFNPAAKLIPQFILPRDTGSVGVISHSGFLFYYLLLSVADRGLKPGIGISCGSDCDLTCVDFIEYFGQDPETKAIIAYLEGIRDGNRLLKVARDVSRRKPIIVLKGGHTEEGMRASASHTGTLAVSTAVWRTLCRQTGIISVDSFEQMMDTLVTLHNLPRSKGRRVGIITTPGGLAVTTTDACNQVGLEVPTYTAETQRQLAGVVEKVGTSVNNPVDLGMIGAMTPGHYVKESIRIVGKDPNIDMLIAAFTGPAGEDDVKDKKTCDLLLSEIKATGKPTVICGAVPTGWPRGEFRFLVQSDIPVFPEPKRAASALAKLVEYSEFVA